MARTAAHDRIRAAKAEALAEIERLVARVPHRVLRGDATAAATWRDAAERAHAMTRVAAAPPCTRSKPRAMR